MSLHAQLQRRQAEGEPIRVGLIGAGKFGSMYLAQIPRTPGVHLVAIADLSPAAAARCASSGPQNASASTVTLTTCLPFANAARQCSTAAIGAPVHSTTTSTAGCATSACQSSPTCVAPVATASAMLVARVRSSLQPTRARLRRAPAGERSAIATRWTPGVRGTCDRYIEPNLPAPIRPTRIGWFSAWRFSSCAWRLIVLVCWIGEMDCRAIVAWHAAEGARDALGPGPMPARRSSVLPAVKRRA